MLLLKLRYAQSYKSLMDPPKCIGPTREIFCVTLSIRAPRVRFCHVERRVQLQQLLFAPKPLGHIEGWELVHVRVNIRDTVPVAVQGNNRKRKGNKDLDVCAG
jgi:hypothetical protein